MPLNRIAVEVAQLSAQYIGGEPVTDDDGTELFFVTDGENGVEINHEVGDLAVAGQRVIELSNALRAYGQHLMAQAHAYQHGPHTGPGAF